MTEIAVLPLPNRAMQIIMAVVHGVRSHALLHALALLVYLAAGLQALWLGVGVNLALVAMISEATMLFLGSSVFIWLAAEAARLWWTGYQGSPVLALKDKLLDDILAPGRIANTVNFLVANGVFFVGFLAIKKAIPLTIPFSWDVSFMKLDRALGFGYLPHEILAPLFQYPIATLAINLLYNCWFLVLMGFLYWQGFSRNDTAHRQKYLVSYFLTWFLGTLILGTLLSSAGPCYYGFVVAGENPYLPLMNYLRATNEIYPIWAIPTQDALWQNHLVGYGDVEGVSAMPSMHVASTILLFQLTFAAGKRWLGWVMVAFSASIFLGSILLGWHYAVDGLAGAAVALACWWIAGKIVGWDRRRRGVA